VAVTGVDGVSGAITTSREVVYCKYVRRELRELSAEDRLDFFNAAQV
jgi:hypothetical protein